VYFPRQCTGQRLRTGREVPAGPSERAFFFFFERLASLCSALLCSLLRNCRGGKPNLQKVTAGMGIKAVQRDRAAQVELLPGLAYRLTTARLSEDAQLLDA